MYVRAALAINGVAIELRAARLILRPVKEEETRERGGYEQGPPSEDEKRNHYSVHMYNTLTSEV